MANERPNKEEYIAKLKEEREKREQGLDYSVPNVHGEQKEKTTEKGGVNPFVKRISLDELIDIARAKENKPPVERAKLTPFITREKEIDTPSLGKK